VQTDPHTVTLEPVAGILVLLRGNPGGPLRAPVGIRGQICLLVPGKVWGACCSQFCVQFNIRIVHFEKQRSID
jgi:hypothetical protein